MAQRLNASNGTKLPEEFSPVLLAAVPQKLR
jgi:hypothetical protein